MRGAIWVLLINLWVLGLLTSYTAGGIIHQIVVIAAAVTVACVIQGRDVHCSRGSLFSRNAKDKVGHVQEET